MPGNPHGGMPACIRDILGVLRDPHTRWLNASILLYVALLPYNVFGFAVYPFDYVVKYTEVALLLVVVFGVHAAVRGQWKLRKAYWLYAFIALHVVAQGLSVWNAPRGIDSFAPAIAAVQYGVLLFILVNVFRSEKLLKAIMVVMGLSILIVVAHSLIIFVLEHGMFQTRTQPSIIGSHIGNYLGYLLVMYGVGVVFFFFRERLLWWRFAALLAVLAWMYTVIIAGIKTGQLAVALFLFLLWIVLRGRRAKALMVLVLFLALFAIQFNIVPLQHAYVAVQQRILEPWAHGGEQAVSRDRVVNAGDVVPPPERQTSTLLTESSDRNIIKTRWTVESPNSLRLRSRGMLAGWSMGKAYPLTGVGPGQQMYFFNHFSEIVREKTYDQYLPWLPHVIRKEVVNSLQWTISFSNPHNFFIMAFAETGIVGLFALLGIVGVICCKGVRATWMMRSHMMMHSLKFLFPSFLVLLMFQQINFFFLHPWFWTTLALVYVSASDIEVAVTQDLVTA